MQNDYIMRMIEQFTQAILAIMQRREAGEHQAAMEQIQAASRLFLREDLETLLLYSPEKIADKFRDSAGHIDSEQCTMCADLLYELALISEAQQNKEASIYLKTRCLYLYRIAIPSDKENACGDYEKISQLSKELVEI